MAKNKVVYGNTVIIDLTDANLGASDGDQILSGKTAYGNDGVEILGVTGTYTGEGVTAQAKTAEPYTTQQVILPDTGYDYLSQVTVEGIYYNETANAYGTTVTIGKVAP